ncbi:MAG: DNA recombination protein RmuC, partial [Ruminococcus sp.]|nr:DNA recombination protein RmuC [Ruminococcus sp.]
SVNRRAKDIADLLEEVRKQYDTFSTLIIKAKKSVTEAGDTLDSAVNRNEIMQKKLRKIDMINPPDADQEDYN